MSNVLKGNFEPKNPVSVEDSKKDESIEGRFEREALKRLGGSIAFVSKKKVMWGAAPAGKGDDNAEGTGDTGTAAKK